jgi:predicted NAD/FAD-dependent oxidoreductase
MKNIAIIGAGISGLVLATKLKQIANVTLFEKSRGVSGRLSTRYSEDFEFDHGAQYFTARSDEFKNFLKPYIENGLVANWEPLVLTISKTGRSYKRDWFEPHYVANNRMNSLCKELAKSLDVRLQTEITEITKADSKWQLKSLNGNIEGQFDWVISSAPAFQTHKLIPDIFSGKDILNTVKMTPCFSLMLGFDSKFFLPFGMALVKDSPIESITVNSTKPMRNDKFCLVVQTNHNWTEEYLEEDPVKIQDILLEELYNHLGLKIPDYQYVALHRWRYAGVSNPLGQNYLLDTEQKLAAIGDWCISPRVESAFLSANSLAEMLTSITT